ncbi:type II toxin-antitoxin system VapC family toxin [Leptolyngbya sp. FACHB-261]|uniref:type II toxin-antitoxin system VapC family toxin n=1 Tax=Leptolyngbya sp. FACHB-261 TaxID=2692806 RepID=UPI00168761A2|nr:PIN domain-containing protein [Leptolyngbya sp. FACHB-261]MBD2103074.1 type II toxin-antitoxin system VapC family toxin [Leptolyngbya sp. FACHB-261]
MKAVFADTFYWVALANPRDQYHRKAKTVSQSLYQHQLITTDEVLVEFLSLFASYGIEMKQRAVLMVQSILDNPSIQVLPQTRASFLSGLKLYEQRLSKGYSLTDCITMETMRSHQLTDVLTADNHFVQEGFNALLKDQTSSKTESRSEQASENHHFAPYLES